MNKSYPLVIAGALLASGLGTYFGCSSDSVDSSSSGLDASLGEGGDESEAPPDEDAGVEPSCDAYCNSILTTCPGMVGADGGSAQYFTKEGCLGLCEYIDPGLFTDNNVDTVGCRLTALNQPGDVATKCSHAGSTGGGLCDDESDAGDKGRCNAFCKRTLAMCAKWNGIDPEPYPDMDTCQATCGTKFAYDPSQPEYTPTGNTLNCRQYHLLLAYEDGGSFVNNAALYCPHLGYPATAECR